MFILQEVNIIITHNKNLIFVVHQSTEMIWNLLTHQVLLYLHAVLEKQLLKFFQAVL